MRSIVKKIVLFLSFSISIANAQDNLTFTGNLIIPNCVINNNNPVTINWGDIEIQTIGSYSNPSHRKDLDIPINCPYSIGMPKLTVQANSETTGDKQGISTSKKDEGLLVYLSAGTVNGWLKYNEQQNIPNTNIKNGNTLRLYAFLGYSKNISNLKPGPFNAGASLTLRYE
ncbi:fimbrial protein [Escherichia coli]|nr:fimbrial protein [Escherichia coli]MDY8228840.1 fimbrial protein [Escherichia coli]MDY8675741.1 fimbrial protein [Escherichia coli]MDY9703680.1 fimbrial protein [Escherichia coli]